MRGVAASDVTWQFTAIPDKPPTIALAKDPEGQARGTLQLNYKLEDDYGVVDAQATFKLLKSEGTNGQPPRALFDAPDVTLALPQARTRNGVGQTIKDLTEHPWAGVDVVMTLVARDEAANEGTSAPFEFRLPERPFTKPMARALVEQRRIFALDADAQARVLTALDALTIAPERFNMESNVYLGLRSIFWQLARAKTTISCATSWRACGTWRCISRTAACRTPSRRCARPRRRCARRSIAARPTRRSRSSPTSCAPRSTSSCRRWPSRCARIRSSSRGRSTRTRGSCARRICAA